jgi:hypothetical protein
MPSAAGGPSQIARNLGPTTFDNFMDVLARINGLRVAEPAAD